MSTKVVIFDVNETLSDLSPLAGAFEEVGLPGSAVNAWFAAILRDGFALTVHGERPAFADLVGDQVRHQLAAHGVGTDPDEAAGTVLDTFMSLEVHPDVADGLAALAGRGLRLVTLSNGSASVAEGLLERAGLTDHLERFLSVDDAGIWKPAPRAYQHALDACRVSAEEAVLVAVHAWDTDGASRAGLRSAWVNRNGLPYPSAFTAPDLEVADLVELAERI
ncbi:haloacid dehalogenase type II [Nocardioides donggukensis]|uniref:Haloacid dehalogenase type II n=1 Tax=Nocardioides donggukensis TaxID=2774019 RepID=A0A927K5C7_9ACTN|nr:haloacid dehalogenase type II [Nocardioides donggukensis]MBD8870577.1 haloacid dehalogenase type II [Nocardioides donggukensis]